MYSIDLPNRTSLAFGDSEGIGKDISNQLLEFNSNILLLLTNQDELKKISNDLKENAKVNFIFADVADLDLLKSKILTYIKENRNINLLIKILEENNLYSKLEKNFIDIFHNKTVIKNKTSKIILNTIKDNYDEKIINIFSNISKIVLIYKNPQLFPKFDFENYLRNIESNSNKK